MALFCFAEHCVSRRSRNDESADDLQDAAGLPARRVARAAGGGPAAARVRANLVQAGAALRRRCCARERPAPGRLSGRYRSPRAGRGVQRLGAVLRPQPAQPGQRDQPGPAFPRAVAGRRIAATHPPARFPGSGGYRVHPARRLRGRRGASPTPGGDPCRRRHPGDRHRRSAQRPEVLPGQCKQAQQGLRGVGLRPAARAPVRGPGKGAGGHHRGKRLLQRPRRGVGEQAPSSPTHSARVGSESFARGIRLAPWGSGASCRCAAPCATGTGARPPGRTAVPGTPRVPWR